MRIKLKKPCFIGVTVRPRGFVTDVADADAAAFVTTGMAVETNEDLTPVEDEAVAAEVPVIDSAKTGQRKAKVAATETETKD